MYMIRFFVFIVVIILTSCNKNTIEMKLLEGNWVSSKVTINSYLVSSNRVTSLDIFDVDKNFATYKSLTRSKTSSDTIVFNTGSLELINKGEMIIKNFSPTSFYREENIKELSSTTLRYTYTANEDLYEFTFKKL